MYIQKLTIVYKKLNLFFLETLFVIAKIRKVLKKSSFINKYCYQNIESLNRLILKSWYTIKPMKVFFPGEF